MENDLLIDASNLLLGRLASLVAKQLLLGKNVTIVNAEKAVISGSRSYILQLAKRRLETRTLGAQYKGPKHPRRPEFIVRRTVRGMLPHDKSVGIMAYRRLKVYSAIPEKLNELKIESLPKARAANGMRCLYVSEMAKTIGWKPLEKN